MFKTWGLATKSVTRSLTLKDVVIFGKSGVEISIGEKSSALNRGTISFQFGAPEPTKREDKTMFLRDMRKIGGISEH